MQSAGIGSVVLILQYWFCGIGPAAPTPAGFSIGEGKELIIENEIIISDNSGNNRTWFFIGGLHVFI